MVEANHSTYKNTQQTHSISIDDEIVEFQADDKTILNCLENNNIEVHYHCRDGFCGACRVKLCKGRIEYPNGEPLAFVGNGEILTCCCVPVSDISIEID